jgi:hypothetical protein
MVLRQESVMFQDLVRFVHLCHGVLLALAAVGFFAVWYRTRFWLPRYVHVLAAVATLMGVAMIFLIPADAPIRKQVGIWANVLIVAICPALVYFFFVFYGGQSAAYKRRTSQH